MRRSIVCTLAATLATLAGSVSAYAQVGTAFTYQGQVKAFGGLLQNPTDFQFTLWNAATGGAQVVPTVVTALNVPVTDGLFTVPTVDFGVNPYTSDQAMWLEISVRYPAGAGPYTRITTRQRLTASPFSMATRGINVNAAGDAKVANGNFYVPAGRLIGTDNGVNNNGGRLHIQSGNDGTSDGLFLNPFPGGGNVYLGNGAGAANLICYDRVGIGTNAPLGLLSVGPGSHPDTNLAIQTSTTGVNTSRWISVNKNGGYGLLMGYDESAAGNYAAIRQVTGDPLNFMVNNTTVAMSLTSNGNVGIGTNTPASKLQVEGGNIFGRFVPTAPSPNLLIGSPSATFNVQSAAIGFLGAGIMNAGIGFTPSVVSRINFGFGADSNPALSNSTFVFESNGNASKPGGGSWAALCDERSKNNIEPMTGTLDRLLKLKGHAYTYKPEYVEKGRALPGTQIGLVAHEVETVFPDWVTTGSDGLKVVTERSTTALMVEAMRDLRNEKDAAINDLKAENDRLKARLEKIEAALASQSSK